MEIKLSEIKGKKIIDKKTGRELATASDVLFDDSEKKIAAIITDIEKGENKALVVDMADVESVTDTIVIKEENSLKKLTEKYRLSKNIDGKREFLANKKLVTKDGEEAGKIRDMKIETNTGNIKTIISEDSGKKKNIKVNNVMVADEEKVVANDTESGKKDTILQKIENVLSGLTPKV